MKHVLVDVVSPHGYSQRRACRVTRQHRSTQCKPQRPNEAWSLEFVHDQLSNGQKFRMLTVVEVFSREALAVEVGLRLRGEHVVDVLNRLVRHRGLRDIFLLIMARNLPAG